MISDHVRRWTSTKFAALHTIAILMLIAGFFLGPDKLPSIIGGLSAICLGYMGANTVAGLRGPTPPTEPDAP